MTVRFAGELISVARNAEGEVVEGDPKEVRRQRDVWTFARKMGVERPELAARRHRRVMQAARRLAFSRLAGWAEDDHAAALVAYAVTVDLLGRTGRARRAATPAPSSSATFCPVLTGTPPALLTGYYEPEVAGAEAPGGALPPSALRPA